MVYGLNSFYGLDSLDSLDILYSSYSSYSCYSLYSFYSFYSLYSFYSIYSIYLVYSSTTVLRIITSWSGRSSLSVAVACISFTTFMPSMTWPKTV